MTVQQVLVLSLLLVVFVLFLWGRWRYDVVAFAALLVSVVLGVVPPADAFYGFGHPATVTVAFVLVISRALSNTGATDLIVRAIAPATGRPSTHIAALAGLGGAMSSFMNNVAALALLMPAAIQSALKAKQPAALILMPLSFGCILGGLVTLIGTPPNIIIATYRTKTAGEPFHMFDFTPVGGAVALAGLIFVATIGWRLIARDGGRARQAEDLFDIEGYVAEVQVPKGGKAVGMTIAEVEEAIGDLDAVIVGLVRKKRHFSKLRPAEVLAAGDFLIVEASPEELDKAVTLLDLKIAGHTGTGLLRTEDTGLMEVVVTPGSRIDGQTAEGLRIPRRYGVALLAVSRQGRPHRGRLKAFRFKVGDVLLLYGDVDRLGEASSGLGCLPLAGRDLRFGQRRKLLVAIGLFGAAIVAGTIGLLSLPVALGLAAAGMVVSNIVPPREIYESVDWPVVVLLGAMIPIGGALEATGATERIVSALFGATADISPVLVVALLLVVTMTVSDILNNAATAVVMAPIAAAMAGHLSVSADPFLMAVAVGASCAFLTPIGHQNNALVMGPGGYRFGDYWRMGLPLEVLIAVVAVPMILWVWPL